MSTLLQSRTETNHKSVTAAIKNISNLHVHFARDYSLWDDMAEAIQRGDAEWINHEFYGPLEIYQADAVWVLNKQGQTIYHQSASELQSSGHEIYLPISAELILNKSRPDEVSTFYDYDYQNRLVAYHVGPILYHTKPEMNNSPYGFIVIGVIWDDRLIHPLSELVQGTVMIKPHTHIQVDSSPLVDTHYTLTNFYGENIVDLNITFNDQSLQLMSQLLVNQAKQTVLISAACILACLALFKIFVIKPIQLLVKKLRTLTPVQELRKPSSSEVVLLSALIDSYTEQSKKISEKNDELNKKSEELSSALDHLKASQSELRKQLHTTQKLSKIAESTNDAIIITDKNGIIEYVNQAWQDLNGYSSTEAVGNNPRMIRSKETNSSVYNHMWQHLNNNEPFMSDAVINKRKDGSLYAARISVFPIQENNHTINYVGICENITEQKEKEALNSQFISLASHQLRTPLTTLRWYAELLHKKLKRSLPEKESQMVADIEENAVRMSELVNRLLNLSRIESGRIIIHPHLLNLKSCQELIKKDTKPILDRKKQQLVIKQLCKYRRIVVDTDLLHEVVINLIINASKYSPSGSTIQLTITGKNNMVHFTVSDSGIGIPKSEQASLFQRFFRASNAINQQIPGTGLGLYLVKMIINQLDGEITITSAEKEGTTVEFFIPKSGVKKSGDQKLLPTSKDYS